MQEPQHSLSTRERLLVALNLTMLVISLVLLRCWYLSLSDPGPFSALTWIAVLTSIGTSMLIIRVPQLRALGVFFFVASLVLGGLIILWSSLALSLSGWY